MRTTAAIGAHKWGYYFSDRYRENLSGKTQPNATKMARIVRSGKRGL